MSVFEEKKEEKESTADMKKITVEFNMDEFNNCDSTVKVSKAVGQDNRPVFSCDLISMFASGMVFICLGTRVINLLPH